MNEIIKRIDFSKQVSQDQKRYSRYVCDSRAIPNVIDGLKPVQRRILWTMFNSEARDRFTKTVKTAGMVMGYHPHGNVSIEDAISQMVQGFSFANNYPLIKGEGTFGDILDPKAIASPRYTEVRLSEFAKDIGLFESIPDIDYIPNYDETSKEPIYFVPKIPLVLLNSIRGIATGFRVNILAHRISDVIDAMIEVLKRKSVTNFKPYYKGFQGYENYELSGEGSGFIYTTGFGFKWNKEKKSWFLIAAPQGWNREKVIGYLNDILKDNKEDILRNYLDHSRENFQIELIFKRGTKIREATLYQIFDKVSREIVEQNLINSEGKLKKMSILEIIKEFCKIRKQHLVRRFFRLSKIEKEKIDKLNELIRFIKEKWHEKVPQLKSKKDLEKKLQNEKFVFYEWLAEIPIYRFTSEEVKKSENAIAESEKKFKNYIELAKKDKKLTTFIIEEIESLKKWDE